MKNTVKPATLVAVTSLTIDLILPFVTAHTQTFITYSMYNIQMSQKLQNCIAFLNNKCGQHKNLCRSYKTG